MGGSASPASEEALDVPQPRGGRWWLRMTVLPRVSGTLGTSSKHPGSQKGPVLSYCRGPVAHALLCGAVPLRMLPVLAEGGEVVSMELLVLCLCIRGVRCLSVSSFSAPSSGPFPLSTASESGMVLALKHPSLKSHSLPHSLVHLFTL